jgi:hypothetical protein
MIDSRSSSRCTSGFTAMIDHTDQFFTELDLRLPIARKPAFSEVCNQPILRHVNGDIQAEIDRRNN